MNISLITPAPPRSRGGNRTTAGRWARFLRDAGHRVTVREPGDEPGSADALLALHAWRSAASIRAFSERHPDRALIVALTGTDVYRFQNSEPEVTLDAMARAHALIGLHDRLGDDIPRRFRDRLHIVLQSARPLPPGAPSPAASRFRVCVIGHLREEKDPLRAARAVRDLPTTSRLQVVNAGRAHSPDWADAARAEAERNPRFTWHGELPRHRVRRLMARSRLMVMSSIMEGGANVVSEACVAGLPVIASDIPGNRGLLGDDHPAYYPPRDTAALRELLLRAEREPAFVDALASHCAALAPHFTPDAERASLTRVVERAAAPLTA